MMLVSCVLAVNYYGIDRCGNIEEGSRTEDNAEGTPLMVLFMYIFILTSVAEEGLFLCCICGHYLCCICGH